MTIRAPHLQDDGLLNCYVAAQHGDALDPPVAEHLTDCSACGVRYAAIARFMDGLREEGEAEADAIFTPARLLAQQHHIAWRIEHAGRAARVINFPRQVVNQTMTPSASHATPRWLAAAAAAGLFLGVAVGSYQFEWRARARSSKTVVPHAAAPAALTTLATRSDPAPAVAADDAFLSELEMALERPRTSELQPLDVLTPHVLEIRDLR